VGRDSIVGQGNRIHSSEWSWVSVEIINEARCAIHEEYDISLIFERCNSHAIAIVSHHGVLISAFAISG
jgi:hypothetical protein